jgi:hypothetical protein
MIYIQQSWTIIPGKEEEYDNLARKESVELFSRHTDVKIVGAWKSFFNDNIIHSVLALIDFNAIQRFWADQTHRDFRHKLLRLVSDYHYCILTTTGRVDRFLSDGTAAEVFLYQSYDILPKSVDEYVSLVTTEVPQIFQSHAAPRLVGAWQSIFSPTHVVSVLAFEDFAALQIHSDTQFVKEITEKSLRMVTNHHSDILVTTGRVDAFR